MSPNDAATWTDRLRKTLSRYDEPLLRQVAGRLIKPRNQWPVDDLVERCVAAADNLPLLDRRLQELDPAARQILGLIARSRQPIWNLGNLVELAMALGQPDGLKPIFALLEAGLLFPSETQGGIVHAPHRSFEQWLGAGANGDRSVFTHPAIANRAWHEPLGLADLAEATGKRSASRSASLATPAESDGLDFLVRLAVLWQQAATPFRRTQQGGFFKRDAERLAGDPLLTGAAVDHLVEVPDLGFLQAALAELEGVLRPDEGEMSAGELPTAWNDGTAAAVESLWRNLLRVRTWNALDGYREEPAGNPFPSAYLLALLLLAHASPDGWVRPATVQKWLLTYHPYWQSEHIRPSRQRDWIETFLLGIAYPLKLVQARKDGDAWLVRLSPTGRWLLGEGDAPADSAAFPQTLLVQPNLEILVYRQGLTPALIGRLTRFAAWKSLGAACTLQLSPETVYRGLESGESFDSIRLTLEQHGTRAVPTAVLDALRTWSNKRDRITVYPSATLLEFASADDLNEALARGLRAVRLADAMAVVANDEQIDFTQFRLSGTRDYALPPEKCVAVEADGVTLTVDQARSDLLLETDLPRFAQPLGPASGGKRRYRITPETLTEARQSGMTLAQLESWFTQRTGQPLSAAARMLMTAAQSDPPRLQRQLVLHVAEEIADGLEQWPETRSLIEARLGPTTVAIAGENAAPLRDRLRALGMTIAD
jgi:hypothetical protein